MEIQNATYRKLTLALGNTHFVEPELTVTVKPGHTTPDLPDMERCVITEAD